MQSSYTQEDMDEVQEALKDTRDANTAFGKATVGATVILERMSRNVDELGELLGLD